MAASHRVSATRKRLVGRRKVADEIRNIADFVGHQSCLYILGNTLKMLGVWPPAFFDVFLEVAGRSRHTDDYLDFVPQPLVRNRASFT